MAERQQRRLIGEDLERDKLSMGEREHRILASLRDPKLWQLISIFFCIVAANSALTFWGPSAVKDIGIHGSTSVGWIMAVIYLMGGAGMILNGAHSDRSGEARYHCALAALMGAAAMAVLGLRHQSRRCFSPRRLGLRHNRHDERHPGLLADAQPNSLGFGCGRRRRAD